MYGDRATEAAENRLMMVSAELERVRKLGLDVDVLELRKRIRDIQAYDETVQKLICANPLLEEAWDNFRVQYTLMANQELLETANEKIYGRKEGICHGCKRPFNRMRK